MYKLVAILFLLFNTAIASSQHDIAYEVRNGLFWIKSADKGHSVQMTPNNPLSRKVCEDTKFFLEKNGLVTSCKDELLSCNMEFLAKKSVKFAFGIGFLDSKKPDSTSKVNWTISGLTNQLKPELLNEYAEQLGIDPRNSVVEYIDVQSLASGVNTSKPIIFKPYEKNVPGGNSWYFRNVVKMLLRNDEDKQIESKIYFNKSQAQNNSIQLVSRFLNCELQNIAGEYVQLPFDFTAFGLRPVTAAQGEEVFTALQSLDKITFPPHYSETEKAIMYGFELSSRLSESTRNSVGTRNIVESLFEVRDGKVTTKAFENAQELTDSLRIVDRYSKPNTYLTLSAASSEVAK